MALKRTFDEINSNGYCFQAYNAEPEEGRPDHSSLSKEDRCRVSQKILEHLTKRLPQHERSIQKKGQSQDQPISLSNLKDVDTPLNFLSLGSGNHSYRSAQVHGPVQGSLPGQADRLQPNSDDIMRPGVSKERQANTQLTILYSGVLKVYDNVPADEAYAIMRLAGTGSSLSPQIISSPSTEINFPVQSPDDILLKAASSDSTSSFREKTVSYCSDVDIPSKTMSVVPQSTCSTEIKQRALSRRTHSGKVQTLNMVANRYSLTFLELGGIFELDGHGIELFFRGFVSELPFARKASLARFLEKRKDRLIRDMSGESQEMSQAHTKNSGNPKRPCSRSPSRLIPSGGLDTAPHRQSTGSAMNIQQRRPLLIPSA